MASPASIRGKRIAQLEELAASLALSFPIETKRDFVRQMVERHPVIVFDGLEYDTEFASNLIPDFFFPFVGESDLLEKATELLIARGLVPPLGDQNA